MPKTSSSVVPDRKAEIRALIGGQDILPEKFVELALLQQDVQRVDVRKYAVGTWTPSKVDDIKGGFDSASTTEWILKTHGPGRYQLSVVMNGEYVVHKVWQFGEPEEAMPRMPVRGAGVDSDFRDDGPVAAKHVTRQISNAIADQVAIKGAQDFLAEADSRASEREIRPAQMMMTTMTQMLEMMKTTIMNPPKTADPMAVVVPLFTQMMTMQQTMFMAMLENNKRDKPDSGLKSVVETLAALEKTLTGKIGQLFAQKDGDAGIDWARVAEVAAPIIDRAISAFERMPRPASPVFPRPAIARPSSASPPQRPGPANGPVIESQPVVSTPVEEPIMRLHEDPEVDKVLHEAADLGVEMLKSRDFASLRSIIELNFPEFLDRIDPDVNSIVYINWLKRLNPDYDKLRSEFVDFVRWLVEHADPIDEPAVTKDGDGTAT